MYNANLYISCMPHASLIHGTRGLPQSALSKFCTAVRSSACTSVTLLELRSTVTSQCHGPVGIESNILKYCIIILFWTSSMLFKPCYILCLNYADFIIEKTPQNLLCAMSCRHVNCYTGVSLHYVTINVKNLL